MSFSSDVKEELAKQVSKSRHCQLAELAGIIELSGRINEKTKGLELDTENLLLLAQIPQRRWMSRIPERYLQRLKSRHSLSTDRLQTDCFLCRHAAREPLSGEPSWQQAR